MFLVAPTFSWNIQINYITDTDVDDAEESLVLLLEFLLIEDLYCKYAVLRCSP